VLGELGERANQGAVNFRVSIQTGKRGGPRKPEVFLPLENNQRNSRGRGEGGDLRGRRKGGFALF